jgi:uncharacterized membrane protein YeaQ/YmgE (transglycosylase-associated protein family)
MFGFIGWIIIGLLAGLLARAIMPGKQPMGCLLTMVLGMVGSLVGGFVSSLIFGHDPTEKAIHASGLIMSTIGAVIVLAIYGAMQKRRPDGP